MSIKYESWFSTILGLSLNSTDTVITLGVAPTVTKGRMYIFDWTQKEWVDFTGVSGVTITWCTRNVSKTADPMTGGTGYNFNAGTPVVLVAMHDQLPDKTTANTFVGNQTITGDLSVSGDITVDEASFIKGSFATSYASTALRDAALGANGVATHPYQGILAAGVFYNYNTTTAQRESIDTGTATPPATTTTLGSVELATQAEVNAGTNTGSVWPLAVQPAALKVVTDAIGVDITFLSALVSNLKGSVYGDGSDGDVTIAGTVTLTRDMYYNNLVIPTATILDPAGYRFFVKGTMSGTGTIRRNGNNGGNATTTGGTAGATLAQGSLNAEIAAVAGGNGVPANSNGTSATGTAANPSLVNVSGANGWGGGTATGFAWGSGTGGTSTRGSLYNKTFFPSLIHPATAQTTFWGLNYKSIAGSGWGGAGGNANGTTWLSWGGGGAGSNGGLIRCAVHNWNFTGVISQMGGNGGNGWNHATTWGWGAGGWGGWAGGNGGVLFRVYSIMTNDATITQTGGTGGTGGTGLPNNGTSWSTGATWVTISTVI